MDSYHILKIIEIEPLVKLAERESYRIRVIPDKRGPKGHYAIAAVRCENSHEIYWLSAGEPEALGASKSMRLGFALGKMEDHGLKVIEELLAKGLAARIHLKNLTVKAA